MSIAKRIRVLPCTSFVLGAVLSLAGCESKGPAQKAGENIDKGVQNAKDAINPPGPSEKVGREVDKVIKP